MPANISRNLKTQQNKKPNQIVLSVRKIGSVLFDVVEVQLGRRCVGGCPSFVLTKRGGIPSGDGYFRVIIGDVSQWDTGRRLNLWKVFLRKGQCIG